jgi:hypothetical protein
MGTRKSQREYNQEIRDFIEYNKNEPIRKDNREKKEYIRIEINGLAESDEELDKIKYKILLANI